MIRLGAPSTAPAGVSIELSAYGKKVIIRAWSPYDSIPAIHIPTEEFAHAFGLIVPAPAKSGGKKSRPLDEEIPA